MMTMSIRLMALKVRDRAPPAESRNSPRRKLDNWRVFYLIGEWIPAWGWMSLAFLVATLGVVGLGFWVMRADHLNRRFDDVASDESANPH